MLQVNSSYQDRVWNSQTGPGREAEEVQVYCQGTVLTTGGGQRQKFIAR